MISSSFIKRQLNCAFIAISANCFCNIISVGRGNDDVLSISSHRVRRGESFRRMG